MKNKSVRYILIFLVVLVWGTIAYKLFSYVNSDEDEIVSQNIPKQKNEQNTVSDTFQLASNYRDPFLGKGNNSNNQNGNPNNQKVIKIVKQKEIPKVEKTIINWPKFSYQGIITNQKSKNQTGLLKINGKDFIIYQGNVINEVEINKLFNDSVIVKYAGELKTIFKIK
ncbi:MAG: hypothetical protein A2X08_14920 [Bacteroidetes bacterium GWA2_32_17]|nr:MAG: hypothetical protein A2X08_14920 [Bacteroidetes bacterium GWA2_32_17]